MVQFSRLLSRFRRFVRNDQLIVTALSLGIGALIAGAVIAFREGIILVQEIGFLTDDRRLIPDLVNLPGWQIVLVPTVAGLVVGRLTRAWMPGERPHGVADVIEAAALKGGRMSLSTGLKAATLSVLSLGGGASAGREGPAVHLGASLASWCAKRLHLGRSLARTLLGCGVAAAVAASFNAPIAGALFASEVVLGHYALSAFAPVVISSVTATALSRLYYGDFPAFMINHEALLSPWEVTVFVGLGILCGLVARLFMWTVMVASAQGQRLPVPAWTRPAVAGFLVGLIALVFPQVLGIGYGVTEQALLGELSLWLLIGICIAKIMATSLSLGFGFSGGIFSPALVIGAMLGGAYGLFVQATLPELSSAPSAYTLVGMASVAAAVLGAPISTALIIFEMTSDFALTLVVMISVVLSSIITRQFHGGSFFHWLLEQRGLDLRDGFETALLRQNRVTDVMEPFGEDNPAGVSTVRPEADLTVIRQRLQTAKQGMIFVVDREGQFLGTISLADLSDAAFDHDLDQLVRAMDVVRSDALRLYPTDTLDKALELFRGAGEDWIAVTASAEDATLMGAVNEIEVLDSYNRALLQNRREEHA
ncbi:MAG: chloride channel protein [Magnetovibrionaceae bacterium]